MVSFVKTFGLLGILVSSSAHEHSGLRIDTNRGLDFLRSEFISGVTYVQVVDLETTSHVDDPSEGGLLDTRMHMVMESSLMVTDLEEGGKQVDSTCSHLAMDMDMMGKTIEYDSDDPTSGEQSVLAPFLDSIVGMKMTFVIDDDGSIVEFKTTLPDGLIGDLKAGGGVNLQDPMDQMSRVAKSLPEVPVQPGDTWDFEMDYGGASPVSMAGTGKLVGYLDYDGHDCAVVAIEGTISMPDMQDTIVDMTIGDSKMTMTVYFDPKSKVARWTEVTTTMTMELPDPMKQTMTKVVTETVAKISVDIQE